MPGRNYDKLALIAAEQEGLLAAADAREAGIEPICCARRSTMPVAEASCGDPTSGACGVNSPNGLGHEQLPQAKATPQHARPAAFGVDSRQVSLSGRRSRPSLTGGGSSETSRDE